MKIITVILLLCFSIISLPIEAKTNAGVVSVNSKVWDNPESKEWLDTPMFVRMMVKRIKDVSTSKDSSPFSLIWLKEIAKSPQDYDLSESDLAWVNNMIKETEKNKKDEWRPVVIESSLPLTAENNNADKELTSNTNEKIEDLNVVKNSPKEIEVSQNDDVVKVEDKEKESQNVVIKNDSPLKENLVEDKLVAVKEPVPDLTAKKEEVSTSIAVDTKEDSQNLIKESTLDKNIMKDITSLDNFSKDVNNESIFKYSQWMEKPLTVFGFIILIFSIFFIRKERKESSKEKLV